jgi:hypothetical protein
MVEVELFLKGCSFLSHLYRKIIHLQMESEVRVRVRTPPSFSKVQVTANLHSDYGNVLSTLGSRQVGCCPEEAEQVTWS